MKTPTGIALMSPLSDAQELLMRGMSKEAIDRINFAKFLIIKLVGEDKAIDYQELQNLQEEYLNR